MVTDRPADAPRLTDRELERVEYNAKTTYDGPVEVEHEKMFAILAELRAARALLADLKSDGCPWRVENGVHVCVYCGGRQTPETAMSPTAEPVYDHRPMEDGKPCLWERIDRA